VTPVLTRAGEEFVTPLSVARWRGRRCYRDLFDLTDEAEMGHIQLSRAADLVVVAPATADLMAKMAGGHADDLASTLLLATDKPVLIAPAMNVRMWQHPATQRNLRDAARATAWPVVGPNEGDMACGEFGPGRMAEPPRSWRRSRRALGLRAARGRHVLVTSGPTHEPIDPVRYIANRSSGAQGTAIAAALARSGRAGRLRHRPGQRRRRPGVEVVRVETAREMLAAVEAALPADAAVFAAAVADWRVGRGGPQDEEGRDGRRRRWNSPRTRTSSRRVAAPGERRPRSWWASPPRRRRGRPRDGEARAQGLRLDRRQRRLARTGIMGGRENAVTLITAEGAEDWPRMTKDEVAMRLARRIAEALRRACAQCGGAAPLVWEPMRGRRLRSLLARTGPTRMPAVLRTAGARAPTCARTCRRRGRRCACPRRAGAGADGLRIEIPPGTRCRCGRARGLR
jgi:phosphopantothenoylcysteine decarboxylase / phosphopantothenate---cysteine ligase